MQVFFARVDLAAYRQQQASCQMTGLSTAFVWRSEWEQLCSCTSDKVSFTMASALTEHNELEANECSAMLFSVHCQIHPSLVINMDQTGALRVCIVVHWT